jgi:hypothetical protein
MKNWADTAKAQGLDLPAQEADRLAQALAPLDDTLQSLTANLPPDLEPASTFHMEEE